MEHLLINHYETAAVILFGIGFLNLLLQNNLVKKVIGVGIMDSSVYLFLASQGYIEGRLAPILVGEVANAADYINPIPAGLVLTANRCIGKRYRFFAGADPAAVSKI